VNARSPLVRGDVVLVNFPFTDLSGSKLRPALIVTYGNTAHKYRPLERDIVVVGRAPG